MDTTPGSRQASVPTMAQDRLNLEITKSRQFYQNFLEQIAEKLYLSNLLIERGSFRNRCDAFVKIFESEGLR
jgi:hypothetical protein